jgi:hypothetical protein
MCCRHRDLHDEAAMVAESTSEYCGQRRSTAAPAVDYLPSLTLRGATDGRDPTTREAEGTLS